MLSKRLGVAHVAIAVLAMAVAAPAFGATSIGQAPPGSGTSYPCGPGYGVQISNASGSGYAVPSPGGVITRWRTSAAGTVSFLLWREEGPNWRLLADDRKTTGGAVTEFAARIPVSGGERIGLGMPQEVTPGCIFKTDVATDIVGVQKEIGVGSLTPLTSAPGFLFNVAADIEPDADHDGYGDETQDGCPTDPARQGPCADTDAPETKIKKHPKKSSAKRKAKFTFSADEPGSKFECKLDKAKFKPCRSPFKRTVAPGRHKFRVRAIDAAGNRDPSVAKFVWTVLG